MVRMLKPNTPVCEEEGTESANCRTLGRATSQPSAHSRSQLALPRWHSACKSNKYTHNEAPLSYEISILWRLPVKKESPSMETANISCRPEIKVFYEINSLGISRYINIQITPDILCCDTLSCQSIVLQPPRAILQGLDLSS